MMLEDTREELEVVNQEPTPLDPSPAEVKPVEDHVEVIEKLGDKWGESPKAKLVVELEKGGHGVAEEENQTPTETYQNYGNVAVKKLVVQNELIVKGKANLPSGTDTKGFDVLELTGLSGTLTEEQLELVKSDHCVIKASTQYFYKEFSAATLLSYKAFPREGANKVIVDYVEITKATKAYELKYFEIVDTNTDAIADLIATLDNTKTYNIQVVNGVLTATEVVG